ncbi:MAG: ATPase, T2SS/T4P/T4SS family, partial [Patescibacteria group bacterium]
DITFASGLRALLRHSPDIIFIGEIRDRETADIAVNAALTGHLLVSTIHTNDAPGAVVRLINLGILPFLISATVNAVLAQRLVRKVCLNCVESYVPTPAIIKRLEEEMSRQGKKFIPPRSFFRGRGCSVCGQTGYQGRTGIFEIFLIDEKVRNLINSGATTTDAMKKAAVGQGMTTMFEDGLDKAARGITSIEEVLRAIGE